METDEQLISQILNGEMDSYRALTVRYQMKVYAVAFKISKNVTDAEDISQEVFLQMYRSLSQFKGEATFSTWIYKLTMNKALDYKRKQNKAKEYIREDVPLDFPCLHTPESTLLKKEDMKLAHEFIDKLPTPYQEVVMLYYFKQLSYREIAESLGIAMKTVESRLYRAKKIMKGESHEPYNR